MSLSVEQKQAVERSGQDVCCVAGPGSGKTRVLVERFAWLVEQGTSPERILAITFTEKAATEIKRRLAARFAARDDLRASIERAPVSTVHGFCARLLREYAFDAGIDPGFTVLDDLESERLRGESMDAVLNRWASDHRDDFRDLLDRWACFDPVRHLRALYETLRTGGRVDDQLREVSGFEVTTALDEAAAAARDFLASVQRNTDNRRAKAEAVEEWLNRRSAMPPLSWLRSLRLNLSGMNKEASAAGKLLREKIEDATPVLVWAMHTDQRDILRRILSEYDAAYRARKAAAAALDFNDLEESALVLLSSRGPAPREIAERYDAILMDEVQDTNPMQWKLLEKLRRPGRFFAVGDLNQSIYGFRSAEPALFLQYQQAMLDRRLVIDRLQTNYRSRAEILDTVSLVSAAAAGIAPHELKARETPFGRKSLASVEVRRVEPTDTDAGEDDDDNPGEAAWLAHRIEELKLTLTVGNPPRPVRWSDFAVLARATTHFDELEAALTERGIPCLVRRGRNYFEEQEVIDLTNLLRFLTNPGHEIALYALLRSPFFAIADGDLFLARERKQYPPPEAAEILDRLLAQREAMPPDRLMARFLDERGYLANAPSRVRANVDKFLAFLRDWHENSPGEWRQWLRDLDALSAAGKEPNAPPEGSEDAVAVMSVHQSKGLEFPVVLLASLQRRPANDTDPLAWSPEFGLGAAWRLEGEVKPVADAALVEIRAAKRRREDLESHRLLYVAMTRAEEHLVLSWTRPKNRGAAWVELVEQALGIEWDDSGDARCATPWVEVRQFAGVPPAPTLPPASSETEIPIEIVREEPGPEAAPAAGVTHLVHFAECPRRYFLSTVAGWPQVREAQLSTGARELGDEVHRLLGGLPVAKPSAEARELRDVFLRSELGRRARAARRIEREFDFMYALDGVLLRGVIDLWFEDDAGIALVDYKTGRDIPAHTMQAYADQLGFYALALEKLTGRMPERAALFLLHQDRTVDVPLNGDTRERCRALLAEWAEAERRQQWPLRPGIQCQWCSFEGEACPGRATLSSPDSPL